MFFLVDLDNDVDGAINFGGGELGILGEGRNFFVTETIDGFLGSMGGDAEMVYPDSNDRT